jgi:hypothetical protein
MQFASPRRHAAPKTPFVKPRKKPKKRLEGMSLHVWEAECKRRAMLTADRKGHCGVTKFKETVNEVAATIATFNQVLNVGADNNAHVAGGSKGSTTMHPSRSSSPSSPTYFQQRRDTPSRFSPETGESEHGGFDPNTLFSRYPRMPPW